MELSEDELAWAPYHRVLGQIVSIWDRVEVSLQTLFIAITYGNSKQLIAIFHTTRSTDLRIEMIRNAIDHSPVDPEHLKILNSLLDRIETQSRLRNRIIHATWRIAYVSDGTEFRPKRKPVRISFIPDVDYASKIEAAYFNGTDRHLFQKEIAKYIFTPERMQTVCVEIESSIKEAFALFDTIHPNVPKTEIVVSRQPSNSQIKS